MGSPALHENSKNKEPVVKIVISRMNVTLGGLGRENESQFF